MNDFKEAEDRIDINSNNIVFICRDERHKENAFRDYIINPTGIIKSIDRKRHVIKTQSKTLYFISYHSMSNALRGLRYSELNYL